MSKKLIYFILTLSTAFFIGCGTDNNNTFSTVGSIKPSAKIDSLFRDTSELKEAFNQEDLPVNEYLTDQLKPIRANFKRINSIAKWTTIKTKSNWETTEGEEAKFYFLNGQLEKITTRHFGKTFQLLTEYYLLNGKLSFVLSKSYKYNRPTQRDSTSIKTDINTKAIDLEKSEVVEDRSYFENGKLLHQINSQDCGSPFADDYLLGEQKRISADFEKLLKLGTSK